jgi:mannose-6-phosphate isomerase-like protein (cupin superfamily)
MTGSFQGLPGGVGISHLSVYDSESPDGVRSGSAHVHLSCTEGYVVIGGHGKLQTLSATGFQEIDLYAKRVVWFTPGVVHRLVNDGDLEIIIVMQNGGLPEAGDSILSFPQEYLADLSRYRQAADLPPIENGHDAVDAHAKVRRDLSVTGFVGLRARVEQDGPQALEHFYRDAAALIADDVDTWQDVWRNGAVQASATTGNQLEALHRGDLSYLGDATLHEAQQREGSPRAGMCGRITNFDAILDAHLGLFEPGSPS